MLCVGSWFFLKLIKKGKKSLGVISFCFKIDEKEGFKTPLLFDERGKGIIYKDTKKEGFTFRFLIS